VSAALPDWAQLPLEQQIAQMVVVRASGHLFDHQIRYPGWEPSAATLRHWVRDRHVGGVLLLGGSAAEIAQRTRQLQAWARVPLLLAADIEEGVGQRFGGATPFPPPMAVGAIAERDPQQGEAYAYRMGAVTAQEAAALGLNWVLAPVADVNNNPDNPVINVRAFGESASQVSRLAGAFVRGARAQGVLTAAKHFPGHGDTATDSHLQLPVLSGSPQRLAELELPPFQAAIAAGSDAVMSAHLSVPAWDAQRPATLSPTVLAGVLRQTWGFEGLIATDALVMGALSGVAAREEIPVLAVEAGADVLLMPEDLEAAIAAIARAVTTGRIPRSRIHASLARLWRAKQRALAMPQPDWTATLAQPAARATADAIARETLAVEGPVPLASDATRTGQNLLWVDDPLDCDFLHRNAPAVAVPRQWGYRHRLLDREASLAALASEAEPILLQVFLRGNPFRGTAGLSATHQRELQQLLARAPVQAVAVYGSPYVWQWLRQWRPAHAAAVFAYGQMPPAQAIACQALFGQPARREADAFL